MNLVSSWTRVSSCWMCPILKYWCPVVSCSCFFNLQFFTTRTSISLPSNPVTNDSSVLFSKIFLEVSVPLLAVNGRNSLTDEVDDLDTVWWCMEGTGIADSLLLGLGNGLGSGLWIESESCCVSFLALAHLAQAVRFFVQEAKAVHRCRNEFQGGGATFATVQSMGASRGVWRHAPLENLKIRCSETHSSTTWAQFYLAFMR